MNYNKPTSLDYKFFSPYCDITKIIPPTDWIADGENTWLSTAPFKLCLYHCISDGKRLFSENVGCHFHFILHVMSDKAAFVSGALLCVQRGRGSLELFFYSASRWQRINLHINAATNSVSLWDYGINKFNITVCAIHVLILELKNNKHNTYYRCTYLYIVNAVILKLLLTSYLKRYLAKTTITLPL